MSSNCMICAAIELYGNTNDVDILNEIDYLINEGAEVNDTDRYSKTPLYYAVTQGLLDVAQFLISKGAKIDGTYLYGESLISSYTLMHIAAKEGYKDIVELFLNNGASVDDANKVLRYALLHGHLDIMKLLVGKLMDKGAKIKFSGKDILYAMQMGHASIIEFLISEYPNDVNDIQNYGRTTLLHMAALNGNLYICNLLLDKGADVNRPNKHGNTPLHYAVHKGNLDIVKLFVKNSANVQYSNIDGKTPLDDARRKGKINVVNFLESMNATSLDVPSNTETKINGTNIMAIAEKQVSQVTSAASRSTSWISSVFGFMQNSLKSIAVNAAGYTQFYLGEIYDSNEKRQEKHSQHSFNNAQLNQTLLLINIFVHKITGGKINSSTGRENVNLPHEEVTVYAANIVYEFYELLKASASKSGISVKNLAFDPIGLQSKIINKILNGKSHELRNILCDTAKGACPSFKQTDKFLGKVSEGIKEFTENIEKINEQKGNTVCNIIFSNNDKQPQALLTKVDNIESISNTKKVAID